MISAAMDGVYGLISKIDFNLLKYAMVILIAITLVAYLVIDYRKLRKNRYISKHYIFSAGLKCTAKDDDGFEEYTGYVNGKEYTFRRPVSDTNRFLRVGDTCVLMLGELTEIDTEDFYTKQEVYEAKQLVNRIDRRWCIIFGLETLLLILVVCGVVAMGSL